ncbi:MAG: molybdopterin-synthase adenylyltransferase MoeB [Nitrospina sp.]|jgi:adenylyltransferase/sulfurtransferase|nr:molybdopterin-synthase adenylyltransferase MoeB [Nitrospina sp.]MBT3874811.1 molybdopterin-synthase adenylyltransferase MoeB [Nitrospina sp.]MBT4047804.1 molybdopterin-synthase adenylyltransferase MoeB [Nitrospina sp.]MBT4558635.1 molybdopterin-synthase adenylyltransferase MoeB [Nitrospina sp.]MBT5349260.1 molybdopterin-synthase adenylyltransferase MoeB [Nitrospina sp.]
MALTQDQINRYSRHLLLPEVGVEGQEKICDSKVLLIGTGGLGSPLALYLAAAGVGNLGLIDFDVVDLSNLQRQVAHGESTVGKLKVDSAKARIADLNSSINVTTYNTRLSSENVMEIFADYDIIVDGTDNFPTRYLASDACVLLKKPYIYGCILRFEGQASVFDSRVGPCYRCLYPEPPPPGLVPSCAEGGVIGILPGIVGLIQANEVIKLILGKGESLVGRLLLFDALSMKFREMKLRKDKDCPICGDNPTITELIDYEEFCGILPVEDSSADTEKEITVEQVKQMLDEKHAFKLIDVREPSEYEICKIDAAALIPLGDIEDKDPAKLNGLNQDDEIVLHCKAGVRSMKALKALEEMGFRNLKSMRGGINEWSEKVDSSVPLY